MRARSCVPSHLRSCLLLLLCLDHVPGLTLLLRHGGGPGLGHLLCLRHNHVPGLLLLCHDGHYHHYHGECEAVTDGEKYLDLVRFEH